MPYFLGVSCCVIDLTYYWIMYFVGLYISLYVTLLLGSCCVYIHYLVIQISVIFDSLLIFYQFIDLQIYFTMYEQLKRLLSNGMITFVFKFVNLLFVCEPLTCVL